MSMIQSLGQQISSLSLSSTTTASQLVSIASGLKRATESMQYLLASSSQPNCKALIDQLCFAQSQLTLASQHLMVASKNAQTWLSSHVAGGTGGTFSSPTAPLSCAATEEPGPASRARLDRSEASQVFSSVVTPLEQKGVEYRPLQSFGRERSSDEIVARLGGGDRTQGSCSSLAFAYAGNVAGYDVLDFRDGDSRSFFSKNSSIEMIANFPGVNALIFNGKDDLICANELLRSMQPGKEYYLATGLHASIVRKVDQHYEYLELQHPVTNGWHILTDQVLLDRFGCYVSNPVVYPNFLIDVDSLANNAEFLEILGYLNTSETEQHKGETGHVR